jgi:hypothetical protein
MPTFDSRSKFSYLHLVILFLATIAQNANGQDASYYFRPVPEPKDFGTVIFAIGPTKASGELGLTDYRNGQSGFVEVGFSGSVNYLSRSFGSLGFVVRGIGVINPVDKGMLRVALEDQLLDGSSNITSISNAEMGSWSHIGGLAGVNLSLPADRLTFEIRALGGVLKHSRPNFSFDYTAISARNEPIGGRLSISGNSSTAMAVQFESGFRYKFSTGAALGVSAGYLSSKPDRGISTARKDETRTSTVDLIPVPTIGSLKPSISMLYLNFGIGVNLGTK